MSRQGGGCGWRMLAGAIALCPVLLGQTFTPEMFAPGVQVPGTNRIAATVVADLDGDGWLDLADLGQNGTLLVWRHRGTPGIATNTYAPPIAYSVPGGWGSFDLAAGDLAGDGKPDLAIAGLGGFKVMGNQSTPGLIDESSFVFRFSTATGSGEALNRVQVSDFDVDGRPEVVYNGAIYRNAGGGGMISSNWFTPVQVFGGTGSLIADFNGDGKPDLDGFLLNTSTPGTITFTNAGRAILGTGGALGDLDGDGKLEYVHTDSGTQFDPQPEATYAYVNRSTERSLIFERCPLTREGDLPYESAAVAVGDLDGDGRPDLIHIQPKEGRLTLFRNLVVAGRVAPECFGERTDILLGIPVTAVDRPKQLKYEVLVADIDRDGKQDLIIPGTTNIMILRNECVEQPSVQLSGPDRAIGLTLGQSAPIEVRLFHMPGAIDRVEFFENGVLVGTAKAAPFGLVWSPAAAGVRTLTAAVWTAAGQHFETPPAQWFVREAGDRTVRALALWTGSMASAGYVIHTNGVAYAWGYNASGQLGNGESDSQNSQAWLSRVALPESPGGCVGISGGSGFALGLLADGRLYGWGANSYGQLGLGTLTNTPWPSLVHQPRRVEGWQAVAAGSDFALALDTLGCVWSWGRNSLGELGLGHTNSMASPAPLTLPDGPSQWRMIAAGAHHSLAVATNGELYAWGYGEYGQLGNGATNNHYSPVPVARPLGVTAWQALSASAWCSFALADDGEIYAWGWEAYGTLGLGQESAYPALIHPTPQRVPRPEGVNRWRTVAAGPTHVLALGDDGELYAWGDNRYGQLGLPVESLTDARFSPTQVPKPPGLSSWHQIAAGASRSAASDTEGQVYSWPRRATFAWDPLPTSAWKPLPLCDLDNRCAWTNNFPPRLRLLSAELGTTLADGTVRLTFRVRGDDPDGFVNLVGATLTNSLTLTGTPTYLNLTATGTASPWQIVTTLDSLGRVWSSLWAVDNFGTEAASIQLSFSKPSVSKLIGSGLTNLHAPGRYSSTFEIRNTAGIALEGLRLILTRLPAGCRVLNARGEIDGQPFIEHSQPIAPSERIQLTLELEGPEVMPTERPEALPEFARSEAPPTLGGTPLPLAHWQRETNGTWRLEFETEPQRSYQVQYSDDLSSWVPAWLPVQGDGERLVWWDYGSPHTPTPPAQVARRFYRVIRAE